MAPGTIKQVQEMTVNGFLLVQRKKKKTTRHQPFLFLLSAICYLGSAPKVTTFSHYRSISRASSVTRQSLNDRSITVTETRTEGQDEVEKVTDTRMTQEQVQKFEEDWTRMWKPEPTFTSPDPDFNDKNLQ